MSENEAKWFVTNNQGTFKTLTLSEVTHEAALLKERKVGNTGFHLGEWRVVLHLKSF